MPELPEVETVCRGLEPVLVGNTFSRVEQRRPDLRFPFPKRFVERLEGRKVEALDRRAKYLLARLDDGEVLVMHLGMTGRFTINHATDVEVKPRQKEPPKHEHIVFHLNDGARICFSDTRRFGLMDLIPGAELDDHALFKGLGVEPLGNDLTPEWFAQKLKGKATPIKAALLNQRLIAGIGNIYACEALHRAGISPLGLAETLATKAGKPTKKLGALIDAIKSVLVSAIKSGGSSLRDYRHTDGRLGRFQHSFKVYGREGKPCRKTACGGTIRRIVQSGRSTFCCPTCQK
jgi:formamidopyrimidine-DNA glycosylase